MDHASIVIIGAGAVGLAVAERLSRTEPSLVVLERHDSFGQETSSRNSEVIHGGMYYPANTLKARLCVQGRRHLYPFLEHNHIPYRKCGKLIVAFTTHELHDLEQLRAKGQANDVEGLSMLTAEQAAQHIPGLTTCGALYSAETGIFDTHGYMHCLARMITEAGALISYGSTVRRITRTGGRYVISVNDDGEALSADVVINCAGLGCEALAHHAGMDTEKAGYRIYPCKGEYFRLTGAALQRAPLRDLHTLLYPVPAAEARNLGIHFTPDTAGGMRMGPNAFYTEELSYDVDLAHKAEFLRQAQCFFPSITDADLIPDTAGIRPKLQGPGQPFCDFIIRNEADKGMPGFINCIGIESPGLTSSLAIADYIATLI